MKVVYPPRTVAEALPNLDICVPEKDFKLGDIPTDWDSGKHKKQGREICEKNAPLIDDLVYRLSAESKRALLVVIQGMDTAGKDGAIRHLTHAINPQACHVHSFKQPTPEEAAHDFLWRIHQYVPARGRVAIFNRSHYEDVLVVKVHGLGGTKDWAQPDWARRYEQINLFEKFLVHNGTTIVKFFLHISKEEQKKRLQERIDDPNKQWKISSADIAERDFWEDYQRAYEEMLENCSTKHAPWYVVPADRKWHRDLVISSVLRTVLELMDPKFPAPELSVQSLKLVD
jgi:PPK2 family polyphosphate:nucleotide phosphotransferase